MVRDRKTLRHRVWVVSNLGDANSGVSEMHVHVKFQREAPLPGERFLRSRACVYFFDHSQSTSDIVHSRSGFWGIRYTGVL